MVHSNDDASNKIPLKSASGLDDEEKNGGEFINDTETAEAARRERMRAKLLVWMKKLTIVVITFIGIALICYVILSLSFSDWSKTTTNTSTLNSTTATIFTSTASSINSHFLSDDKSSSSSQNATSSADNNNTLAAAAFGNVFETTTTAATLITAAVNTKPGTTTLTSSPTIATATATISTTAAAKSSEKPQADLHVMPTSTTQKANAFLDIAPSVAEKFESKLGVFNKAAVCSDREICSIIGSHILEQGGTAVDSAIATLLCNGIVNMHSMGIGGGMLMNIYIKDKQQAYSVDAREVAPFAAYQEMFDKDANLSLHGGLAIAVPGELMGYHKAHERFGKLPWKQLVEPSIKVCNEGFYLSEHQRKALKGKFTHVKNNTVLTNVFVDPTTNEIYAAGTKLKPLKELCATYSLLAENGPLDFYNGTLAQLVVEDLKELGSTVTAYDLESYGADLVSSISMQLGDDILYASPPVSSSAIVANILSILEGYNFTKTNMANAKEEALTMHRFAEAMKFGFAKRWELGDLRFNDVRELVSKLTSPEYGMQIRAKINDSTVLNNIYEYGAQFTGVDDEGTSHAAIIAPNGDAVSVTSSVNDYFGAGQAGKRTGILFNSGMNDFTVPDHPNQFGLPPSPSNFIDARKRAMSSMSPMLLADQDGEIRMAVGAAGGSKIISAVVEVVARVMWFGQNIKEAIDAPRFHHQLLPNLLEYEYEKFSDEILKMLRTKGQELKPYKDAGSVVCGIVRNATALYANADFRKRGGVAGF